MKLCAIAKNEGPYLVDWVFHHLQFGFDAVEVWVNGTDDGSLRILRAVTEMRPQVTARRADRLLEECLAAGAHFQHAAYARMARRARRDGFTHAAFLDLDEYWTPRDLSARVQDFLPTDPDVNVVSFQWCADVPDRKRPPFAQPLQGPTRVQLDRHVKSVVRLDDSIRRIREHTASTRRGVRLLVRDPFPLVDRRAQRSGSFVPDDHLGRHWGELPEAFVLHEMNRSELEYVANLGKGLRQVGSELPFKTNRFGWVPTPAPVLTFEPPRRPLELYREARAIFRREVGVETRIRRAEQKLVERAEALVELAAADPAAMAELRRAFRGVSAPALERAYPGWDLPVHQWVDALESRGGQTWVVGWAFAAPPARGVELGLRDAQGREWTGLEVTPTQRPEVHHEHEGAPLECGFEFPVPEELEGQLADLELLVRPAGAPYWETSPLHRSATIGRPTV